MRGLPFFKPKNKPQFAGLNFSDTSSGGGGGGGGGSSIDFSYTEVNTGTKWVSGKDIYKKSFALTNITNGQQIINVSDLNVSEIVFYWGNVDVNGNGTRWRITGNDTGSAYWYLEYSDNKIYSNMSGLVGSERNGTITIFYTKLS